MQYINFFIQKYIYNSLKKFVDFYLKIFKFVIVVKNIIR